MQMHWHVLINFFFITQSLVTPVKTENQESHLDPILVDKFFTKKKTKAPPPPTPTPQAVAQPAEVRQLPATPTVYTESQPSQTNNSESTPNVASVRSGGPKKELSISVSSNSSPQPSISSASASPALSTESRASSSKQSVKEAINAAETSDEMNNSLNMMPSSEHSQVTSSVDEKKKLGSHQTEQQLGNQVKRNSSTQSNSTFSEHVDDSISTIETMRQKKQNSFKTGSNTFHFCCLNMSQILYRIYARKKNRIFEQKSILLLIYSQLYNPGQTGFIQILKGIFLETMVIRHNFLMKYWFLISGLDHFPKMSTKNEFK